MSAIVRSVRLLLVAAAVLGAGYYFFTNEDELIMRLQACNAAGQ